MFNNDGARQRHEKVVHKGQSLKKDKYKCDQCDYVGESNQSIRRHIFKHTEDRPIICVCGTGLFTESELKRHLLKCENAEDFQ